MQWIIYAVLCGVAIAGFSTMGGAMAILRLCPAAIGADCVGGFWAAIRVAALCCTLGVVAQVLAALVIC